MIVQKYVVNIGRQLGSGGKEIGEKLARELKISFYDKELINLASEYSGLCEEFFEKADEKTPQSFVHFPFFNGTATLYSNYLSNNTLFKIQSNIIRKLASEKSCLFVGRCADYILRDHTCSINIFISSYMHDRIKRLCHTLNLSETEVKELIHKTDKCRSEYYNFYTYNTWGAATTYHLCVNASVLGIEGTVTFIKEFVAQKIRLTTP
jgi:cytidylate kinase